MMVILIYLGIATLLIVCILSLIFSVAVVLSLFIEVPFLPSGKLFKKAIEYLEIKDGDKVLDMGSGDGRVLLYASAKYPDASFVGIEKNVLLLIYSKMLATFLGRRNLKFECCDFNKYDIGSFDGIYMYLLPQYINKVMGRNISRMKSGCRVVSFKFPIGNTHVLSNKIEKYSVEYMGEKENIYRYMN